MDTALISVAIQSFIAAVTAILIFWIKTSMDKGIKEIASTLININSRVSSVQVVHVHPPYSKPIVNHTTYETTVNPQPTDEEAV